MTRMLTILTLSALFTTTAMAGPGLGPIDRGAPVQSPVETPDIDDDTDADAPADDGATTGDWDSKKDFMRDQLEQGKRGKDLAQALADEHENRKGEMDDKTRRQKSQKAAGKATGKYTGDPQRGNHKRRSGKRG